MKKVLEFIKETQRTSKILFSLWVLTNIIFCRSPNLDFSNFIASAVLFFIPAIAIEYRKNPILAVVIKHQVKKPERYVSKALIASIVCLLLSFISGAFYMFDKSIPKSNIIVFILLAVVFSRFLDGHQKQKQKLFNDIN